MRNLSRFSPTWRFFKKLSPLLLLAAISLPAKGASLEQPPKLFDPQWAELNIQYGRFHSVENYDLNGNKVGLSSLEGAWDNSLITTQGRYNFTDYFAMGAGFTYSSAQKTLGQQAVVSAGPQSVNGSLEFLIPTQYIKFSIEALGSYSFFQADQNSQTPLLGDGAHTLGGNLAVLIPSSFIDWRASAGYLFRSEGLSQLVPFHVGGRILMDPFFIGLGLQGFWSVIEDAETDSYRTSLTNKAAAGSLAFRSPNPNSSELLLTAEFKGTELFTIYSGYATTIAGTNSASGSRFFLGLHLNWQVFSNEPPSRYPWSEEGRPKTEAQIEKTPTPNEPNLQNEHRGKNKRKPTKKRRPKRRS